jgi:hypothetical protein
VGEAAVVYANGEAVERAVVEAGSTGTPSHNSSDLRVNAGPQDDALN